VPGLRASEEYLERALAEIWSGACDLVPSEAIVSAEVGDEAVLLHIDTGVYYGLDEVGARIWALLAQERDPQAIWETLVEEYEVEPQQLRRDMSTFLQRLIELQLVQVTDSG
jgi:hypothetical protein